MNRQDHMLHFSQLYADAFTTQMVTQQGLCLESNKAFFLSFFFCFLRGGVVATIAPLVLD
jgi:hypothetical protein